MNHLVQSSIIGVALIGVTFVGCASMSLPPERPATDVEAIAGRWEGFRVGARTGYRFEATSTIHKDGTWEIIIPALSNPGPRFIGRVTVQDGKYRWRSDTTGGTGTWILHEGNGRRVIVDRADDGAYAEYRPVK